MMFVPPRRRRNNAMMILEKNVFFRRSQQGRVLGQTILRFENVIIVATVRKTRNSTRYITKKRDGGRGREKKRDTRGDENCCRARPSRYGRRRDDNVVYCDACSSRGPHGPWIALEILRFFLPVCSASARCLTLSPGGAG